MPVAEHKTSASGSTPNESRPVVKKRRFWKKAAVLLIAIAALLAVARALAPGLVRDYVNRTLDRNPNYFGSIGPVQISLWRGAYNIRDVKISKMTGNVPVPLFAAKRVEFSTQWDVLLHGKLAGQIRMEQPELNFVDGGAESESQTGGQGPWLGIIRDLFPFKINSLTIHDGSVHFHYYNPKTPVDVYLTQFEATVDNLTNVRDETDPLMATARATALAMDNAKLDYTMTLDPFSYRPTFHLALRVLGLDTTKLNPLTLAYGKFDFERGWLDLVVEADSKEGVLTGYVKPLFRNVKVFSLIEDLKGENVLQYFWQALVGGVTSVFKNYSRDQFGTLIPFSGDLTQTTSVDLLATIGNILRNAFVRAYLPQLEQAQEFKGIEFGPPEFNDILSAGGD